MFRKDIVIALICGLILLSGCVTDGSKKGGATNATNPVTKAIQKREATSELAERLYSRFHANPATQAQKDENALIDYAVDKNLDAVRTASGLYYVIHKEGVGKKYIHGQPLSAHYQGYFLDGKVFDSSYKRGVPITFNVGQMVPGWNEALKLMNSGTKAQLLIPSSLAYGDRGFAGFVPPNTPLIFDLETLPLGSK